MNATKQMIHDFDKMVNDREKYPGQNWLAVIYRNVGNGTVSAPEGMLDVPCVCWDKDKRGKEYTFRTMLDDEIKRGDIVYIPEQDRYYLLEKLTRRDPQCWSTIATPCNMRISIYCPMPAEVNDQGYIISPANKFHYIHALPCVQRSEPRFDSVNRNAPGTLALDDLTITLQQNEYTEQIALGDEFERGLHVYSIVDKQTDNGIITMHARAKAGETARR